MKAVIFSRDRACQLDLLIRSIKKFSDYEVYVTYNATSDFYRAGYEKLIAKFPDVTFTPRANFKDYVLSMLDEDYITFFCDDEVFINEFSFDSPELEVFKSNPDVVCLSLRHDKRYTDDRDRVGVWLPPEFNSDNTWNWRGIEGLWGYPMSVTAHIFKSEQLKPLIEQISFNAPNTFEQALYDNWNIQGDLMICFDRAKTINVPMNKVQTEFVANTPMGFISVEYLNDMLLTGWEIDLGKIIKSGQESTGCQKAIDFEFVREEGK